MAAAAGQNEHSVPRRQDVCVLELAGLLGGLPNMPMSEPLDPAWFGYSVDRWCEPRPVTFQIGCRSPGVRRGGSRVAWSADRQMVSLSGRAFRRQRPGQRKRMGAITTTDGTEIFYKDRGSGQPVVFSHG